jgi:hypothetical protein
MGIVIGLPNLQRCDSVLVIVDRLTKMRHLISCITRITAEELGDLFVEYILRLHGLLNTIVFDCGSILASKFWIQICKRLGIDPHLSTAFHL